MKVEFECTYCGYRWVEEIWNKDTISSKVCKKGNCRTKNLLARDLQATKVDYYQGSPPFQEPKKDNGWPYLNVKLDDYDHNIRGND